MPARQQPFEAGLAQVQRELAEIAIALDEDVQGAELDLLVCLPMWRALKSETPSTPRITTSPSRTKRFCRSSYSYGP
jgi:hypothetical protein